MGAQLGIVQSQLEELKEQTVGLQEVIKEMEQKHLEIFVSGNSIAYLFDKLLEDPDCVKENYKERKRLYHNMMEKNFNRRPQVKPSSKAKRVIRRIELAMDVVQNLIWISEPPKEPVSPCRSEVPFTEELQVGWEIVKQIIESSDSEEPDEEVKGGPNLEQGFTGLGPLDPLPLGLISESEEELTPQLRMPPTKQAGGPRRKMS